MAYEFAGFRLEPARRALFCSDGSRAHIGGKPFDTLLYLVEHAGEPVSRDELLRAVWPKRVIEDNNLNQAVATLRRVIGEPHIVTLPGRGYQFVTPVRQAPLPTPTSSPDDAPTPAAAALQPVGERAARRTRRWPIGIAAAAAGATVVVLLALGPYGAHSPSLAGSRIEVRPLTTYPGQELSPALAPDGTRVAFSWQDTEQGRAIYVTQIGVGKPARLTEPAAGAADTDPAWSPDNQRIAFLRRYDPERFDVMLMPALGGPARRVASGEMHSISVEGSPLLAWTPDSRNLLFTTLRAGQARGASYGLHRLSLAEGIVSDLGIKNETLDYDTSPAVSPDGRWLAFTRFARAGRLNRVMLQRLGPGLALDGPAEPAPDLAPDIHHALHWSPTGDRLWFTSTSQLFEWPLGSSPHPVSTLGARFTRSAMSIVATATGARAVFVERSPDRDLLALELDPHEHRALGAPVALAQSTTVEYHPRISPDGRWLAFVSDRSGAREVWLAKRDGTEPRQLTQLGQLIVGFPRWSPDGKYIAFHSAAANEPRVIYSVEVESGVTKRLFNGCCPGGWSADGKSLYVTELGEINYIARVDVEKGTRERLVEGETATESLDGQYLLFARSREPGYFRWPLGGGPDAMAERLVVDYTTANGANGGIAPVRDGFYYVAMADDATPLAVRFYDYASAATYDVAPVPASMSIGLTVSPDGTQLVYAGVTTPGADIVVLDFMRED